MWETKVQLKNYQYQNKMDKIFLSLHTCEGDR